MAYKHVIKRIYLDLILGISLVSLIIGLLAPIMTFKKLLFKNKFSIISGLISLFQDGDYFLFLIIFVFSVAFPIFKILFLIFIRYNRKLSKQRTQKYLHSLTILSKWSMLDVFVVALLVVTVKLGIIGKVIPHYGIYIFAFAVMMCTLSAALVSRENNLKGGKS